MAVTYTDTGASGAGYYSSVTGGYYADPDSAHAAEAAASGQVYDPGSAYPGPPPPTGSNVSDPSQVAATQALTDPNSPSYMGPGYTSVRQSDGSYAAVPSAAGTPGANGQLAWQAYQAPPAPTNPNGTDPMGTVNSVVNSQRAALTPGQVRANALATRGSSGTPLNVSGLPASSLPATPTATRAPVSLKGALTPDQAALFSQPAPGTPGGGAPTVDTSKVDSTVAGVNNTISSLLDLANTSRTTSAAEAQLLQSDQLARVRSQQELQNSQSAALGAARSGNRRDQGLLQRQAIGESAYLGQESQRQAVQQQANLEGNLAQVRATEENNDLARRGDLLDKAAGLGLNVAALQTDIGKADLGAATQYLNNEFQSQNIDKQLSVQQTQQTLAYLQAMSAIQYDYDKMSDSDKQHTQDLMMQQYGVDAQTADVLAQIKATHKSTGEKILDGLLGLTESAAPVVATAIGGGKKAGA